MRRSLQVLSWIALAVVILAAGFVVWTFTRASGFSARMTPTAAERVFARTARHLAIPSRAREARNPVPFTAEVWAESRAHFADHCATCHANDGSGQTEIGRDLYPPAPDMRLPDTQRLSDGELYYIIENGVRLTGMPAWGTGGDDDLDTWKLVHFIRHLREMTPEQLKEMEGLNPKTPDELQEEQEDEKFLAGDDTPAPAPAPHVHVH